MQFKAFFIYHVLDFGTALHFHLRDNFKSWAFCSLTSDIWVSRWRVWAYIIIAVQFEYHIPHIFTHIFSFILTNDMLTQFQHVCFTLWNHYNLNKAISNSNLNCLSLHFCKLQISCHTYHSGVTSCLLQCENGHPPTFRSFNEKWKVFEIFFGYFQ